MIVDKLKMHSPDLTQRNIDAIAELLPTVVTETLDADGKPVRAVDFDALRQELSDHIVEGPQERYQLDWPGKREALFAANAPIAKTLRPVRAQSVDFDTTKNLFIEGENLETLKLLQESYLGKIKFIYIDPPYNTGRDFVYEDDYAETTEEYLARSGQIDDTGSRLIANTESNGRFHSDWLSMMYPRLKLARNLLTHDGLVLISIDEGEGAGLRILCDEVFGRDNFVEQVAWKNKYGSGALTRGFANVHEYVLVYSRYPIRNLAAPLDDEQRAAYKLRDENFPTRGGYITQPLATRSKDPRPNLVYPIEWNGREIWPDMQWIWSRDRMGEAIARGDVVFSDSRGSSSVRAKQYLRDENGRERLGKPVSVLIGPFNQSGTNDIARLFAEKVFEFPKPVNLIKYFLSFVVNDSDDKEFIALDFFAGSGSTAHAVMALNAEDGGNRKFIAIQVAEPVPHGSAAAKVGLATIAEICKERIRRAGSALDSGPSAPDWGRDIGFRVLRVDTTNMADVSRAPDQLGQEEINLFAENIKPDRSGEDLLFQVLIDWGLELTMSVSVEVIDGHEVFVVEDGALIACFDNEVRPALVREIASRQPLRAVFRDSGFATVADRINAEQVFAEVSPATDVKAI